MYNIRRNDDVCTYDGSWLRWDIISRAVRHFDWNRNCIAECVNNFSLLDDLGATFIIELLVLLLTAILDPSGVCDQVVCHLIQVRSSTPWSTDYLDVGRETTVSRLLTTHNQVGSDLVSCCQFPEFAWWAKIRKWMFLEEIEPDRVCHTSKLFDANHGLVTVPSCTTFDFEILE